MSLSIAFFVVSDFELLDLSGPLCAFHLAAQISPKSYQVSVLSTHGGALRSSCGLSIDTMPFNSSGHDSLIIIGAATDPLAGIDLPTCKMVKTATKKMRRVASVCGGAFLLASTGLLDGKRATTHWRHADRLQSLFPAINVTPDKIYVEDESLWTSAGITAGIDLALALIQNDYGSELSRAVAREMVVYHRRLGGQSQYSTLLKLDSPSDRIRQVLTFARNHLDQSLSVQRLADAVNLSVRQLTRSFTKEAGISPAKAIERLRIEMATPRVEGGSEPLEKIARDVGFADANRMRDSFVRQLGSTPQTLRNKARTA